MVGFIGAGVWGGAHNRKRVSLMNKVTKGTLAAAAAGALLLGGAGTYATWSDNETLNAGSVSTGVLDLELGTGSWADQNEKPVSNSSFVMAPGDTLTYSTTATITAEGDNLSGTFDATSGLTATATVDGVADTDVSKYVTVGLVEPLDYSTITGANDPANKLAVDGVTGAITFAEADTYVVPLDVTVTLDADLQQAQDLVVTLGDVDVTLSQS